MVKKNQKNIIKLLRECKLPGRGGGGFPVADKWEMVNTAKGNVKFVVCNGSEGEPGVLKDWHILNNYPELVVRGIEIALEYLQANEGIIYLNEGYYKKLQSKLKKIIGQLPIEVFSKPHIAGYIGGEETTALNTLENKRIEPRFRPPYPPVSGLYSQPTLVNNVETFYDVALIEAGKYEKKRFFTVSGDCLNEGVYEFLEDTTIENVLKNSDNYPEYDFFVQVGGGASGVVLNQEQLDQKVPGSASIRVYSYLKHQPLGLIKYWLKFFKEESCGQCTPCREGTYRLMELVNKKKVDWPMFFEILDNLTESSFCALGSSVPVPIRSFLENVGPRYKLSEPLTLSTEALA